MEKARLIFDSAANGAWNMSVDQALLETAEASGLITLRFYTWAEPTLSLGYFQSYKDRDQHRSSSQCAMVRRKTGGGAILHDHELTYSLSVPSQNRWSTKNTDLYQLVHQEIIKILAHYGIQSQLHSEFETANGKTETLEADQTNFMCFKRRSAGDIVIDGHKVVGSAQRRNKNSLLQHGSILLAASAFAPSILGINNLYGESTLQTEFMEKIANGIIVAMNCSVAVAQLSDREKDVVEDIYSSHFNSDSWNKRR